MSLQNLYGIEKIQEWVNNYVDGRKFVPVKVTIKVEKDGSYNIDFAYDGRNLRQQFWQWVIGQFETMAGIAAPSNAKELNKLWISPMEAVLAQVFFVAGLRYSDEKPSSRYTNISALSLKMVLQESLDKASENGLTISDPNSLKKIGIATAASGKHYQSAIRRLQKNK